MERLLRPAAHGQSGTLNAAPAPVRMQQQDTPMSPSKLRIRPKAYPDRQQEEPPAHDPPSHPEHDRPVFSELDPGTEPKRPERVVFHEDDRLR